MKPQIIEGAYGFARALSQLRHKLLKIIMMHPAWDELCYTHIITSAFNRGWLIAAFFK